MSNKRENFIRGLREMAQFLEANPDTDPTTYPGNGREFSVYDRHEKSDAAMLAKLMGKCDKEFTSEQFVLSKTFGGEGGPRLAFYFMRATVCERVVVGQKVIPAQVVPAKEEYTLPEVVIDEVEWRCNPILA